MLIKRQKYKLIFYCLLKFPLLFEKLFYSAQIYVRNSFPLIQKRAYLIKLDKMIGNLNTSFCTRAKLTGPPTLFAITSEDEGESAKNKYFLRALKFRFKL